ncbi:MAG: DNA polymerase III subunit delta [Bryobacterales bacterium]|nr:DNA polymerase III subunit delta [Bryobacterales bacterium]
MAFTSDSFIAHLGRQPAAAAYFFLGPEMYGRDACRRALVDKFLGAEASEDAFTRHSLDELTMAEVLDDARAMSLFAPQRVIWVTRAEGALPRGRAAAAAEEETDEESSKASGDGPAQLAAYMKDPSPGVVLVFDSSRYEFDGEDKARVERLRKYFAAVPQVVEFPRMDETRVRKLTAELAKKAGIELGAGEVDLLVEATAGSAQRIETEIEKLRNYAATLPSPRLAVADLERLVPQARSTTIFALVNALGRKDRSRALDLLDTLLGEGEYLPLALGFLATQFRQALVAREAGLRGASQVQSHFQRMGTPMWPSRAEQVWQSASAFSPGQLREGLQRIAATDRALRDTRPDDRVVLEEFVLGLTK